MIKTLLIANRGEIACRIIKTARALNIKTIAIYSEDDINAKHVDMADDSHLIAKSTTNSYLNITSIIQIAQQYDVDAIHPGYGFLSENAEFARQCVKHNIIFVGPSPDSLQIMGSKQAAKVSLQKANIPLIPGYHGDEQAADKLKAEADKIGYPIMLKAALGGGGKGMRLVHHETEFHDALDAAKREAIAAFSDDKIIIEKALLKPRHIECQILADTKGHCIYLFERECSIQRRHQKIIEEAPAPNLSNSLRHAIGQTAVKIAQSIDYVGAGTIEFLLDDNDHFYFMEMNTRLQVEHGITELITNIDIVEWQLKIASGETLTIQQDELSIHGHAIEMRLYAEDPENHFLPSTGEITHFKFPSASHFRTDHGLKQGDVISVNYDPMIAKVMVHGNSRQHAITQLLDACADIRIGGPKTNLGYLTHILSHQAFQTGNINTQFIPDYGDDVLSALKQDDRYRLILAAVYLAYYSDTDTNHLRAPWMTRHAWRLSDEVIEQTIDLLNDKSLHEVTLQFERSRLHVLVDETKYTIADVTIHGTILNATVSDQPIQATASKTNHAVELTLHGKTQQFQLNHNASDTICTADDTISAPMSANVIKVLCESGQSVKQHQPLVVLESMKMEHTVTSPRDGIVEKICFHESELVHEGDELVLLNNTASPESVVSCNG